MTINPLSEHLNMHPWAEALMCYYALALPNLNNFPLPQVLFKTSPC